MITSFIREQNEYLCVNEKYHMTQILFIFMFHFQFFPNIGRPPTIQSNRIISTHEKRTNQTK